MPDFLLDTNAINQALDKNVVDAAFLTRHGAVFITHIQFDELSATGRPERQRALLETLQKIDPTKLPTSAAVWNLSKWDEAEYGDANGLYEPLLAALNARNSGKLNNAQDALIGVTAMARGLTLVTNDFDLAAAVTKLGGQAMSFEQFVA